MLTAAAHLHGTFNGSLTTPGNASNWFDPANGKVPDNRGYLNQKSPNNITVSHNETEFGASDGVATVELDFHHDGHTRLTIKRDPAGDSAVLSGFAPYTINIKSDTFKNYRVIKQHEYNLTIRPEASFNGDTLTIITFANGALPTPAVFVAEWHLYVSMLAGLAVGTPGLFPEMQIHATMLHLRQKLIPAMPATSKHRNVHTTMVALTASGAFR
jgi:hypothetical protein